MPDPVVTPPETDPEPEGVIEVAAADKKEKMVPLAALTAERARIRQVEAEKHAKELEPLKAKAARTDQLEADIQAIQPYVERLKQKPELMRENEPPAQQQISDADATRFAQRFELYSGNGLDIKRAREIIADQRVETERVARAAAQEAIKPVAERTAIDQSRANFIAAAQAHDAQGRALVDPQMLAAEWAKVPAELSSQRDVAELILDRAIGAMYRAGRTPPAQVMQEPVFSEAAGGGRGQHYQISDVERKMAAAANVPEDKWTKAAQKFVPGAVNVISGD